MRFRWTKSLGFWITVAALSVGDFAVAPAEAQLLQRASERVRGAEAARRGGSRTSRASDAARRARDSARRDEARRADRRRAERREARAAARARGSWRTGAGGAVVGPAPLDPTIDRWWLRDPAPAPAYLTPAAPAPSVPRSMLDPYFAPGDRFAVSLSVEGGALFADYEVGRAGASFGLRLPHLVNLTARSSFYFEPEVNDVLSLNRLSGELRLVDDDIVQLRLGAGALHFYDTEAHRLGGQAHAAVDLLPVDRVRLGASVDAGTVGEAAIVAGRAEVGWLAFPALELYGGLQVEAVGVEEPDPVVLSGFFLGIRFAPLGALAVR